MKQKIVPGQTLDIATTSEVGEAVARALTLQNVTEYQRYKGSILLNAAGIGQVDETQAVRASAQYDLILTRVAIGGGGVAAGALVLFYENSSASEADLLEVIQLGAGGRYSDSFANQLYLPANSKLIIAVSGGPANGVVSYNLQGEVQRHPGRNER